MSSRPFLSLVFRFVAVLSATAVYCLSIQGQAAPLVQNPPGAQIPRAVDQEQFVPYWTSETGWNSELQLRNNALSH
jgi:hypothetical protein